MANAFWNPELGEKLQALGAGFSGNLPQYYQQKSQAEAIQLQREEKRRALAQERQIAAMQDAQVAMQLIDAGQPERALELANNRVAQIEQLQGDPSDTIAFRDLLLNGDIEGARSELELLVNEGVTRGMIEPLLTPEQELARKKYEQDYGEGGFKDEEQRLAQLRATLDQRAADLAQEQFDWEKQQGRRGTIPPEYELSEDGKTFRRITGGPAEDSATEAQKALKLAQSDYSRKFGIVDSAIDDAISIIESDGRWAAGVGSILSGLPESSARNLAAKLDTVKANLGFDELQTMRANSPTGGALGNVSEREIAFLQAIQGNLDQGLEPQQLYEVLKDIKDTRTKFRDERSQIMGGSAQTDGKDKAVNVGGYVIKEVKPK